MLTPLRHWLLFYALVSTASCSSPAGPDHVSVNITIARSSVTQANITSIDISVTVLNGNGESIRITPCAWRLQAATPKGYSDVVLGACSDPSADQITLKNGNQTELHYTQTLHPGEQLNAGLYRVSILVSVGPDFTSGEPVYSDTFRFSGS